MADPISVAGLALAVVATLKDVYLVGRFIYRTIDSANHRDGERAELKEEFEYEILFLEDFGKLYFSKGGFIDEGALGEVRRPPTIATELG